METSSREHNYRAAYHGLAAMGMAGVFLLMAVPALQLAYWIELQGHRGWPESDRKMAAYGGYIGAAMVELLCWVSVAIALRGFGSAGRTGESRVLCFAGLCLGLFASALWIMCGIAWHEQSAWIFR